jgi:hypothetical protein
MVQIANKYENHTPQIILARTPDQLNRRTQLALVGGGYHEAWHTKYSKRDAIQYSDVWGITQRVGEITNNGGKFDAKLAGMLRAFCAIIEDIRIERRGCEEYPGVRVPMHDLQDFIMDLEKKMRAEAAKALKVDQADNARGILLSVFRDLGLGYNTQTGREAIAFYKKTAPEAVVMCAPGGILHPHLQAAKALAADDKLGYIRVSMECVIALWKATQSQDDQESPELSCPNCGASASNLVIRPARDSKGIKIRGKGEMECKACGFKCEVPLPDVSLSLNQNQKEEKKEKREVPKYEDMTQETEDGEDEDEDDGGSEDSEGGKENSEGKGSKGKKGDSKDKDGESEEEEENGGSDGDEEDDEGEDGDKDPEGKDGESEDEGDDEDGDSKGGKGDSEDGDSDDGDSEDEDGDSEDEDGDSDEDGNSDEDEGKGGNSQSEGGEGSKDERQNESSSNGAGGHQYAGQDPAVVRETASSILNSTDRMDPLDSSDALAQAFASEHSKEQKDLLRGELPWNPYDPSLDEARMVRSNNTEADRMRVNGMLKEVKPEIATLRARLRSIVRAQEMTDTEHGLRRGKKISERMLVDSKLYLMDKTAPKRAYQDKEDTLDTSLSMAICLDQSGSMHGMLKQVAKAMMVLTEPVEAIGGKVLAFGFRDGRHGQYDANVFPATSREYHRIAGVQYDIFKNWDERFSNVKWRYAHTQASGGTPMADGIQFGLMALNTRMEAHRILAVITDGAPNSPHEKVIAGQIRRAREKGIHVIGIGIGIEASYVKGLFHDYVHVKQVADLPHALISKLNEVCDFGGKFRGKRIKLDNRMVKRVS